LGGDEKCALFAHFAHARLVLVDELIRQSFKTDEMYLVPTDDFAPDVILEQKF
jgi:hypothetical protein